MIPNQKKRRVNSRMRMATLLSFVLLVVTTSASSKLFGAEKPTTRPPNILFIMADDLGPEWISSYGGQGMKTPHIDALAKRGMKFSNAYSMPKCTPTRLTLLTGTYPFRHGWIGHWDVPRWGAGCHFDPQKYVSFARVMKSAGYTTCAAGKWQINDFRVQPDIMQRHGFDEHCMWTGYETGVKASAERYWNPYINVAEKSRTYQKQFGTDVFVDFLVSFMKRNRKKPMLLYFPMALPHGPLVTTPKRPNATGNIDKYKAMVEYVDLAVGRLVKAVDELGLRKNTIIIFTTDNGSGRRQRARLNGRLVRGGKDTLWESGMRCPFIVNAPGLVPAGVTTDALTDFTDMLPTFADFGNAKLPQGVTLDGHSLKPLLTGKAADSPRKWILAMGNGTMVRTRTGVRSRTKIADRVIRDKRFKMWIESGKPTKLFDLKNDPGEQQNLIDSSVESVMKARKKLQAVWKSLPPDARPRYIPTPAQPWDRKIGAGKKRKRRK